MENLEDHIEICVVESSKFPWHLGLNMVRDSVRGEPMLRRCIEFSLMYGNNDQISIGGIIWQIERTDWSNQLSAYVCMASQHTEGPVAEDTSRYLLKGTYVAFHDSD